VRFPSGEGVRVDHGIVEGQEISSAFDPMIAKIAVHGATRQDAIESSRRALRETVLLGTTTNTAYLERVLAHPAFGRGETHTGFLEEHAGELAAPLVDEEVERCLLAAAALSSPRFDRRLAAPEPLAAIGPWRN
jgi:acetyl/propionyl-CoA carboxylase alpha subunit